MAYDSGYPTEPVGGSNPYYRCVYCKLTDPQINGEINNHLLSCQYRKEKQGYKITIEQIIHLQDELDREDLQVYTSVAMAARAMEDDDIVTALAHLKVDADKLYLVSSKLYKIVMAQY